MPPEIPAAPNLGPFIIIQSAIALVIIGAAMIAWLRGSRSKLSLNSPDDLVFEVRAALENVDDLLKETRGIRSDNDRFHERLLASQEDQRRLLDGIKDSLNRRGGRS
jgi:hypothetical protein